jgi:hypothetical protein
LGNNRYGKSRRARRGSALAPHSAKACLEQVPQLQIKIVASPGFGPIFGLLARNVVVFGRCLRAPDLGPISTFFEVDQVRYSDGPRRRNSA